MDRFEAATKTEEEMREAVCRIENEEARFQEDARHIAENMKLALEESKSAGSRKEAVDEPR